MDISVIVPFYNSSAFLARCCEALVSQEYPRDRYEVLMVDNGSRDGSAEIVRSFEGIQLLSEPERGSYAARNLGLRHARGKIVAFTDADCVPRADWLARIARSMNDLPVQILMGDRHYSSREGLMGMLAAYEARMAARTFDGSRPERYYGYTNNMAFRKTVFDRIGDFDRVQRGGDSLLLRRAITALGGCGIVRYDSEMVVQHLEIISASDYLEKKATYGHVRAAMRELGAPEPLPLLTRIGMAGRTLAGQSASDAVRFCGVLLAGMVCFERGAAGGPRGRNRRRFP
jgi:glycosyltransferase involved in cell wall biosynthesis